MSESHYEIYPARDFLGRKRWRWRYRAGNGEIIASGEAYSRKIDCEHAISLIRDSIEAPIREMTS